mgnify:CR=1 FL=1
MPIVAGFNIGKEVSLDLVHPTLGIIPFGLLMNFTSRPMKNRLQSTPITNGGKSIFRIVYTGWEGAFEIDRSNGVPDALMALLEANFYGGQPETYFLITETISNPDSSIDEYRFRNAVIEPEDAGSWKAEEKVTIKLAFAASIREKV